MGGRGVKRKIKGVYVHGNVGKLLLLGELFNLAQTYFTHGSHIARFMHLGDLFITYSITHIFILLVKRDNKYLGGSGPYQGHPSKLCY